MSSTSRRRRFVIVFALAGLALTSAAVLASPGASARNTPAVTAPVPSELPTGGDGPLRDGWYPAEPGLTPPAVGASDFGQLFSTSISGSVYAQPLFVSTADGGGSTDGGVVIVATMTDYLYGIDPISGAVRWSTKVGTAYPASSTGCADVSGTMGILSTPTVDPSTGIVYAMAASYLSGSSGATGFFLHALNASTGKEQSSFPVQISGTASNQPSLTFTAADQWQRPALLELGGVIYAGFAGHCDKTPYQGWVTGVSTAGKITTLWSAAGKGDSGAGIWQSGGGLVSDGAGQIMVTTGNATVGTSPSGTILGDDPPANLSESVVRLGVQPDGTLKPTDFFAPYDAAVLDDQDLDFGSTPPVALPPQFGTASYPDLSIAVGKEGYVYLLNRDSLGGVGTGAGAGDGSLDRIGPNGGVWSIPATWPGDGGYIYFPTLAGNSRMGTLNAYQLGTSGTGTPTIAQAGSSAQTFGYGSSAPVVSSTGTQSGSAVVWVIRRPDSSGSNASLQAYQPVPNSGTLTLIAQWPIGTSSKFTPPGIGNSRVYVATNDGHILGFGAPIGSTLTGTGIAFPNTVDGSSSTGTAVVTASATTTISGVTSNSTAFVVQLPAGTLPVTLKAGKSLSIPVTFSPTATGQIGGTLTVQSTTMPLQIPLSGTGLASAPDLVAQTAGLSMGGAVIGSSVSDSVSFSNVGAAPLTVTGVDLPSAPFSVSGAPVPGQPSATIPPGGSFTVTVTFAPSVVGSYTDSLEILSNGGNATVALTASATAPSALTVSKSSVSFGTVDLGAAKLETVTLKNSGGSPITIAKSKPPVLGGFVAQTSLPEGTTIPAGGSVALTVAFIPSAAKSYSDQWLINGNGTQGLLTVTFTGTGRQSGSAVGQVGAAGWSLNGAATSTSSGVVLTPATASTAGSTWWGTPVSGSDLAASFSLTVASGTGADGTALVFGGSGVTSKSLGATGSGLGYGGLNGYAVVFGEHKDSGAPSANYVGLANGSSSGGTTLKFLSTKALATPLQNQTVQVLVTVAGSKIRVYVNGVSVLTYSKLSMPATVHLGFTAATGALTNVHTVGSTDIVTAAT